MTNLSEILLERALRVIPGGVNSPVRAFKSVGGKPPFIKSAHGSHIFDVDGHEYLDYVCSWGAIILGHASKVVEEAILEVITDGTSFGAPTENEVLFAELLCASVPGLEMVRLVNSGTEATMAALRLARGYTGRDFVIKFDGCYHGHADSFLVSAGSGVATLGISGSAGVPAEVASKTIIVDYNNLDQVEAAFQRLDLGQQSSQIAAVIVEPIAGNMGMVLPEEGFLSGLRNLCDHYGALLIFDEVMSGFRVALGGAGELLKIRPDLITLGKVIGGGLPVGAFGGRRDIMSLLAPVGSVYQAGTLSGNPLAVSAGLAVLRYLIAANPYEKLGSMSKQLTSGMCEIADRAGVPLVSSSRGGMFGYFFSKSPVASYRSAKLSDIDMFNLFFHAMLKRGVYLAPSAYEAGFLSLAHSSDDISRTLQTVEDILPRLA